MSFQSQGERARRATSRLLGAADAVVLQSCVRLALVMGFAAVAWLLSGYVTDSAAHAEPIAENATARPADGGATAPQVNPLTHWMSKPGHTVQDVVAALGNSPWKASAPDSALSDELQLTHAQSMGDEVVVVSQEPHTPKTLPELERRPFALDTLNTPFVDHFRPLAQVAETLLAPVEPTALDTVEQVISSMPLTSPVSPVGQEKVVTQSPMSDTASLDSSRAIDDVSVSKTLTAAPSLDTSNVLPELETQLPQGMPGIPGSGQGGMGNVSGNSGSGLGSLIGGAGVMATEYAAPTMSDQSVAGASEVTHVNPDVLEDPTFSPD